MAPRPHRQEVHTGARERGGRGAAGPLSLTTMRRVRKGSNSFEARLVSHTKLLTVQGLEERQLQVNTFSSFISL